MSNTFKGNYYHGNNNNNNNTASNNHDNTSLPPQSIFGGPTKPTMTPHQMAHEMNKIPIVFKDLTPIFFPQTIEQPPPPSNNENNTKKILTETIDDECYGHPPENLTYLSEISSGKRRVVNGIDEGSNGLSQISNGKRRVINGIDEGSNGMDEGSNAIDQVSNDKRRVISNSQQLASIDNSGSSCKSIQYKYGTLIKYDHVLGVGKIREGMDTFWDVTSKTIKLNHVDDKPALHQVVRFHLEERENKIYAVHITSPVGNCLEIAKEETPIKMEKILRRINNNNNNNNNNHKNIPRLVTGKIVDWCVERGSGTLRENDDTENITFSWRDLCWSGKGTPCIGAGTRIRFVLKLKHGIKVAREITGEDDDPIPSSESPERISNVAYGKSKSVLKSYGKADSYDPYGSSKTSPPDRKPRRYPGRAVSKRGNGY